MGLRDALRSLRGGATTPAEEPISDTEAPEPTWFQPRSDGRYDAALATAAGARVSLRFSPGGKVSETSGTGTEGTGTEGTNAEGTNAEGINTAVTDTASGPNQDPCRGEYTGAGRFNVQRRFERMISYAVLEMQPDGFQARRIDGADRSTVELSFTFVAD